MDTRTKQKLIRAAIKASRRAVAPYSRFAVGAALLAKSGRVYLGTNIESASFGLTCCAERVALFKALSEGVKSFRAMAVVAPMAEPVPCGACRQLLAEFAPTAVVLLADSRRPATIVHYTVAELMPRAFRLVPPR